MELSGQYSIEGLKSEIDKAQFFTEPDQLINLKVYHTPTFIVELPDDGLFLNIAGAAWDAFHSLGDTNKSGKFLDILKDDNFLKNVGVPELDSSAPVETAIAFVLAKDGPSLDEQAEFIDFCRKREINVNIGNVESIAEQMKINLQENS